MGPNRAQRPNRVHGPNKAHGNYLGNYFRILRIILFGNCFGGIILGSYWPRGVLALAPISPGAYQPWGLLALGPIGPGAYWP